MTLLDGRKASTEIRENIRKEVESLNSKPHLVIIMIGENPASKIYVNKKLKACQKAGFNVTLNKLGVEITERELLDLIQKYNSDDDVDGMIVQLPVPEHISKNKIIKSIDPSKDVDGFHPDNMGKTTLDIEGYNQPHH